MSGGATKAPGKPKPKRKRPGAPRGNRNALTHGFYSDALEEADKLAIDEAEGIAGLDQEIAVLRWKLRQVLVKTPNNVQLQLDIARTLARLVQIKYGLPGDKRKGLQEAIVDTIRNVGLPMGIAAMMRG